jgi:RNA polymerase sigma-70 factor (ECF subfamily)
VSWDFHKLFKEHAKEIARALRRRGLSEDAAADITQDTFLRVMTAAPKDGADVHNPRAYLHQVSRNLSINLQRRQQASPFVAADEETLVQVADLTPSPEATVHDRQRLKLIEAALKELPDRTRKAFELHRLDERTISDIAHELGISTTRAWTLIREAYRHIVMRTGGV